jgi:galactokinase
VKAARFAEQLAAAGLEANQVEAKVHLFDRVLSTLQAMTGHGPDYVGWVPGRLEVFGTHTDYAGGRTLVSAVPRGFAFAAKQRTDGQLHVVDALASGESVLLDTRRLTPCTGWRHYVEIAIDRLARNFPGAALGADIAFASDLPRAAGMSSSSALIVGTAATLIRLSGLREHPEWRANIRGPVDEAGYYACIENGRTFGLLAGNAGVGTHGGSEDHAAMVCGEPGAMTAFSFVPMRRLRSVRLPPEWGMVVATSGVAAEKTGAALEPYNRLAQGTAILFDIWNTHERPMGSLGAALASDPAAATHLETLARTARVDGWSSEALVNRLRHFSREDARVEEAVVAFRDSDGVRLKQAAEASQAESRTLLGNQVDETVTLARLAMENGALASRNFGAGFGGSVWAVVEGESNSFAERWLDSYCKLYPTRRSVAFVGQPGPLLMEFML